ncbi:MULTISPECIES: aldo/keto reductase [Streptomyces]|uniref:aldo/keto reductase n=1 Tax=Streptomyces TaxID=1883 RepID=UPI00182C5E00|nr:aldo/keto reductase [Streptomyces murinus]MBA9043286.1 aryl-alcohol dehydrogenase-like predicted oxidoreductase [Streptomyces murinus]
MSEEIVREAIHPYPDDVLIATKAGLTRVGPDVVRTDEGLGRLGPAAGPPVGRGEYRATGPDEHSSAPDHIELLQLHRGDPKAPLEDQVGELRKPQGEGKIAASGLSQVTVEQTEQVRAVAEIATVQTATSPTAAPPTSWSTAPGTASSSSPGRSSAAHGTGVGRRWRSPGCWARPGVVLPGTSKGARLEDNLAAVALRLSDAETDELTAAV